MDSLSTTVWLVLSIISATFLYFRKKFSYWKDRGIKYLKPSFPLGNISICEHFKDLVVKTYNMKDNSQIIGAYIAWKPFLVPTSLDLIQHILVKDFSSFHERGMYVNEDIDPLSAHMFSLDGEKWKTIRSKLSPTFTSGKMKFMFSAVVEVADRFNQKLAEIAKHNRDFEMKDLLGRFTTDVIGSCAFGVECNTLADPNAAFCHYGKKVFDEPQLTPFKQMMVNQYPDVARFFKMRVFDKDVCDFFLSTVRETIDYREKNNVRRNDFMDLLIQLKNEGCIDGDISKRSNKLSWAEVAAQAFLFFIAGFETSSTAMMFALYELALNPDMQERGRQEITDILEKHDGKLTYEAVKEMVYIDNIISESLRKYPPVVFLLRKATRDYQVPNSKSIIEKGMEIFIPVYAIHHDPEIYPNPEVFDPDRFTPDKVKSRHPMAFLGFGDGPRNCVGLRFGRMQSRIGLITLLRNYRLELSPRTQHELKFDTRNPILSPKSGIFAKLGRIHLEY